MPHKQGLFVTGTGTGVGKTVLAGAIVASLRAAGIGARALKPIVTGLDERADPRWPPDPELLADASGRSPTDVTLLRFGPPVSPHLAAELRGAPIDTSHLAERTLAAAADDEVLIVEGVGGLLVPLADRCDVRTFARALGLPVVVAASRCLGTINHTLLTLEAARAAGLEVVAVVLTPWPRVPDRIERSNRETIERLGAVNVFTLAELERADPELLAAAGRALPIARWLDTRRPRTDATELIAADRCHVWHPFTQQLHWGAEDPVLVIDRAEGCTLYDTDGNAYIDGVSSLWCNVHGHRRAEIDGAIRAQLDRVAHSTLLGLSHQPAIELAERLIAVTPPGLTRVFYSDSGSSAVEVALKVAFQWWVQRGQSRRCRFVSLEHAYHGDTLGAVAIGGIDVFHALYRPLLFESLHARAGDADHLSELLTSHEGEVAAVIVEPLVQGAAGMLMQPAGYLRSVRELCDAHGALMICDEVATGFGRTGKMFACDHEDVAPDLLCVGKGLTGGYLPLAATLASERLYEGFLGRAEELRAFFHGHTFTGNPLGCAAAVAALQTFERDRTLEVMQPKIELLARALADRVAPLPAVADIRQLGFMVGIELVPHPAEERIGQQVTLAARARGVIIRPLGDVIVLMPPLAISADDLRRLVASTAAAIEQATSGRMRRSGKQGAPLLANSRARLAPDPSESRTVLARDLAQRTA